MSPPLSPEIERQVRELFQDHDVKLVSELLLSYGEESHHREVERVRRGVLAISAGNVANVQYLVKMAKADYRDLIVAAEYVKRPPEW